MIQGATQRKEEKHVRMFVMEVLSRRYDKRGAGGFSQFICGVCGYVVDRLFALQTIGGHQCSDEGEPSVQDGRIRVT